MSRAWLKEMTVLTLWVTVFVALFGLMFGWFGVFVGLLLGLGVYLGHHLRQLYRFERWLRVGRLRNPPESWGLWGRVFEQYYRWQRRYYSRKKKLGKVIREFRDSTSAMPDGTLVLDGHFCIQWFNDAAEQMLRLSSNRDLGQSILNLVRSPVFRDYVHSKSYETPAEFTSPQSDQVLLSARLIPYGRDQYLLLFRDVTPIHRLQMMRRDFVANASHELRSPLTVISGYLQAFPEGDELPEEWRHPIKEMQVQAQRMSGLVEDLLELSRLETELADASVEQMVDVPDLIERVLRSAKTEDEGEHELTFERLTDQGVLGVERELHSAFSNLVMNAIRYSSAGSPIRITWSMGQEGEGVFSVSDQGIGIDSKHIPFVTQRFYRVDSARNQTKSGTGLGLAIVKHVLQRHGAHLEIDSVLGEGSTFRCIFPSGRMSVSSEAVRSSADGHQTETPKPLNTAV
ncbi:MAG TPA: phosphate regulon sensor histidine kinase PhoR [Wenzhouxiangella sp.]